MSGLQTPDKGGIAEEMLRDYFLELGYFVIRGAIYAFESSDVTDIDLWLYQRTSSFSRERFNVDVKNKKSPQALERILWAKGLQQCLRLDGALVATSDVRAEVKAFGDQHDIVVLDGTLLTKLKKRYSGSSTRLAEEEFTAMIRGEKNDRVGDRWLGQFEIAKSRVLTQLDFDGCNSHISEANDLAQEVLAGSHRREIACRLFYFSISLALLTLDFIIRDFAFVERKLQSDALNNGLRFGTFGKQGAEKVFSTAAKIASSYLRGQNVRASEIIKHLQGEAMKFPVEILTEFILKINQTTPLFELARSFEEVAFARIMKEPANLTSEQRGVIGAVLDFQQIDRKRFFEALDGSGHLAPADAEVKEPLTRQAELQIPRGSTPEAGTPGGGSIVEKK